MTKENVCVKITNEKDRLELLKVLVDNGQEIGVLTKKGLQTGEDDFGNDQMIYPYIGYVSSENAFSGRSTIYPNRTLVSIAELEKILKQKDMTQNEKLKQALSELEELKVKIKGLIKPEIVVGKWYRSCIGTLAFVTNSDINYGITYAGDWSNDIIRYRDFEDCDYNIWTEATHKEVEKMLIDEAKKRYKVGDYICRSNTMLRLNGTDNANTIEIIYSKDLEGMIYCSERNALHTSQGCVVFIQGEWATVVDNKKSQLNDDIEAIKNKYPEYNITVVAECK